MGGTRVGSDRQQGRGGGDSAKELEDIKVRRWVVQGTKGEVAREGSGVVKRVEDDFAEWGSGRFREEQGEERKAIAGQAGPWGWWGERKVSFLGVAKPESARVATCT